jgi:mevalonate kinase
MRVRSAIPIGAGLGSSAAFSVGLSTAFHRLAHLNSSAGAEGLFIPDLESINNWALQCEKMFHATPSGIDNTVCTYGGLVKFQNRKVSGFMNVPEARILLVDTQISRQTKLLVEGVRQKHDRLPAVIDPILEAIGNISHQMVEVMQHSEHINYSIIGVNIYIYIYIHTYIHTYSI